MSELASPVQGMSLKIAGTELDGDESAKAGKRAE